MCSLIWSQDCRRRMAEATSQIEQQSSRANASSPKMHAPLQALFSALASCDSAEQPSLPKGLNVGSFSTNLLSENRGRSAFAPLATHQSVQVRQHACQDSIYIPHKELLLFSTSSNLISCSHRLHAMYSALKPFIACKCCFNSESDEVSDCRLSWQILLLSIYQ